MEEDVGMAFIRVCVCNANGLLTSISILEFSPSYQSMYVWMPFFRRRSTT